MNKADLLIRDLESKHNKTFLEYPEQLFGENVKYRRKLKDLINKARPLSEYYLKHKPTYF